MIKAPKIVKEAAHPAIGFLSGGGVAAGLNFASQSGKIHSGENGQKKINPYKLVKSVLLGGALGAGSMKAYNSRDAIKSAVKSRLDKNVISKMVKNIENATANVERATGNAADAVGKAKTNRFYGLFSKVK
jgi:hypothetical protein